MFWSWQGSVACLPSGNKLLHEKNVLASVITKGGFLWKLDLFTELTKNMNDFNTTLQDETGLRCA